MANRRRWSGVKVMRALPVAAVSLSLRTRASSRRYATLRPDRHAWPGSTVRFAPKSQTTPRARNPIDPTEIRETRRARQVGDPKRARHRTVMSTADAAGMGTVTMLPV